MRILIALDRSEYAEIVLEHGLDQAARHPDSEIHVVSAAEDEDVSASHAFVEPLVLEGLDAFNLADRPVSIHVRRGRPAPVVASVGLEIGADLIVVGRFHSPSAADTIVSIVDIPTLVVGLEGHVLEPQCPACREVRRATGGETMFCDEHAGDRMLDLTRLPTEATGTGIW
jgi:nucleotide-binding universal stress UspA family protein